ncbi:excisionase family DNA binding protein [Ornithinicoccus hortensis]|uniref:Excisionase family DNA binding protein n=1 Tax=Ornithinicoccus hortensis TaxID=82346 RepID=A0A542YR62_9MICO|nr:excisionase family DNA binding protein [Ornithinicoccus hortensis]
MTEPGSKGRATPRKRAGAAPVPPQRRAPVQPKRPGEPVDERKLWWIDDVALYLGVPRQTIYSWRQKNYGPPAIKVGKHLRWHPSTVIAWAKQQERPAG